MPMLDKTATQEIADDARARSNVLRLAAAQALTGANSAGVFATRSDRGGHLGGDFRNRLDRRRDLGALHLARHRAAVDVRARPRRRHAADRSDLARLWPPGRLHHRDLLRSADRRTRRVCDSAFIVLAVLRRDLSRRALWRGVAILSLRSG